MFYIAHRGRVLLRVRNVSSRSFMPRWLHHLLLRAVQPWQGILTVFGCVAIATFIRFAMTPLVGGGVPFITFFPTVLIVSVLAGSLWGMSALLLTSLIAAYVWLNPPMSLDLTTGSSATLVAFWLSSGLLMIVVGLRRAVGRALSESEKRSNILAREMAHRVRMRHRHFPQTNSPRT